MKRADYILNVSRIACNAGILCRKASCCYGTESMAYTVEQSMPPDCQQDYLSNRKRQIYHQYCLGDGFGPGKYSSPSEMIPLRKGCNHPLSVSGRIIITSRMMPIPPIQCVRLRQKSIDLDNVSTSVRSMLLWLCILIRSQTGYLRILLFHR